MKRTALIGLLFTILAGKAMAADHWLTSYDEATKLSKKTGKPIMAYFTGSDWCIWCHRLDNEVLDTPTFEKWADDHVVLLKLDFPQSTPQSSDLKAQNVELQKTYSVVGFPTVHVLDYKGDNMVEQGYEPGGPQPWITKLGSGIDSWFRSHPDTKAEYERAAASRNIPIVNKPLHAKADLRGKSSFEIVVDKWLTLSKPDFSGKVVVLELWNSTSDRSAKLATTLSDWSKQFANNIAVLAVSNENPGPVLKFIHSNDLSYSVGIDSNGIMARKLGVGNDPYLLVIGPDGTVRWQGDASESVDALTTEKLKSIVDTVKG